jgi:hypothetical protein
MNLNSQPDKISELDKIQDGLSYTIGKPDVSHTELMDSEFIRSNTEFNNWRELLGAAGVQREADFEKPEFNEFIKSRTRFDDWEEMLIHASNRYSTRYEAKENLYLDLETENTGGY